MSVSIAIESVLSTDSTQIHGAFHLARPPRFRHFHAMHNFAHRILFAFILALTHQSLQAESPLSSEALTIIRKEVETLRGMKFKHDVPLVSVSKSDIQAIVTREIDKAFPGQSLADYMDYVAWMDLLPPHTDLKALYTRFLLEQAAGMYDTETQHMLIPSTNSTAKADARKTIQAKLGTDGMDGIVLAHEYTHALEHQYWPLDTLTNALTKDTSDHEDAYKYIVEGTATLLMLEAYPAQVEYSSPGDYIFAWRVIHSGVVNALVGHQLHDRVWETTPSEMPGIPVTMARQETLPYVYGYLFCSQMIRLWGLDGLDRVYAHPPVCTKQVLNPETYWEWRDFPVQVTLPRTLHGDWQLLTEDSLGATDIAVLFGSQFESLAACERLVRGWKGDRAGFYKSPEGHRLLVWGSEWETPSSARHFADACINLRKTTHKASLSKPSANLTKWNRPDGRLGLIVREGRRVILLETDKPEALTPDLIHTVVFARSPEETRRASQNNAFLLYNPLLSWQKDGDYALTESLWGLLWRHDRNDIGHADKLLLGLIESRRTSSFSKWGLGWGLLVRHESEARRGLTQTTLLPCGTLWDHFSAQLPNNPNDTVTRDALLWGMAGSYTRTRNDRHFHVLPFGLLFRYDNTPTTTSVHLLATGVARTAATPALGSKTRFRILGVPVLTLTGMDKKSLH